MKKILLLLVIVFFTSLTVFGQNPRRLTKNVDITGGYIPDADYNAFKGGVSVNNIMIKRVGLYTSFEIGLDNDYFSNTIGPTVSITNYLYVFAGVDVYSKSGLVSNDKFLRKEIGIGVLPFDWGAFRLGYSFGVGPTIAVGFRINLYEY